MSADRSNTPGAAPGPLSGREPARAEWSEWQRDRLENLQQELLGSALLQRQPILDALKHAIREATANGRPAAALFFDLNNFVGINAAWGPQAGDEVLTATGQRVAAFVEEALGGTGSASCAGRLDGDHFLVVVNDVEGLGALRSMAVDVIGSLARPLEIAGHAITVNARAAIVHIPEHGRSVTSVLGRGFRLLNTLARSKADGVAMSEAEDRQGSSRTMLEHDLTAALSSDELFLALQPKVSTKTGEVRGAEALARWDHPECGALPPQVFIETAEKSGLIFDLGLRILRDACRASNALAGKGQSGGQNAGQAFNIAVNVSPYQLAHPEFLSRFLQVIDREGANPEAIEVEVTETAAMMGGEQMRESLRALRRCGMSVAIDDFGTGFSNLAALSALPADELKIDQSLVTGAERGGRAKALLDIAVQLGRNFGLTTVAEGVETKRQLQYVTELGCDLVQGYLTGRPVRVEEFAERYLKV